MSEKRDNRGNVYGVVGTILVHLLLLLAIYFFGLSSVIPPEEDGITINYGDGDTGEGMFEPASLPAEASVPDISSPSNQEMVAQETEESIEVKRQREAERKKEQEKRRKEEEERKALEARAQKASSTTQNAFKGFGGTGSDESAKGQGTAGGQGNQGSESGSVDGISYSLGGRKALNPQKPPYNQNIDGYIVVEIEVNPQGKVISARAGAKGTTIGDATMRKLAEQTAFKTKFTGTTENNIQVGTITYKYLLN